MQPSDESLFTMYIETSDPETFGTLFDRFHGPLLSYLRRFFGEDVAPAEDAIQMTFQRVFEHADQFDPALKFSTWLYRIARNCAIDLLRQAQRAKTASFNDYDPNGGFAYDPPCPHTLEAVTQALDVEFDAGLRLLLDTLDPQDKRLVSMVYDQGKGYAECAEELGWSVNNCRVRLFRALKYLKGALEAA